MPLLPSEKINIDIPLPVDQVVQALLNNSTPDKNGKWSLRFPDQTLAGKADNNQFEFTPVISNRNSFNPIIKVRWTAEGRSTKVELQIGLPRSTSVFLAVWLFIVGLFFLIISYVSLMALWKGTEGPAVVGIIGPLVMFGFGIGLARFGYKPEADKAKKNLLALLNTTKTSPAWEVSES